MSTERKVKRLKSRLRSKYLKWDSILDEYSCGMNLARTISPRVSNLEREMDGILVKLKALGEDIPEMPWERAA